MNKNYTLQLIFFICACFLLILGSVFGYFYASSTIDLTKFENLPTKVQALYVKRSDVDEMNRYLEFERASLLPSSEAISSNLKEVQEEVRLLRGKNASLYQDNVILNDTNWKLAHELKKERSEIDKKSKAYQKIKELSIENTTLKDEEIKRKNEHEVIIEKLNNKIAKLEIELQKREFNLDLASVKASQKQFKTDTALAEKNAILLDQTRQMRTKLQDSYNESIKIIDEKEEEIAKLKELLSQKELNINSLLSKHANELIDIEEENSIVLRDLKQKVASLQIENKKQATLRQKENDRAKKEIEKIKSKIPTFDEQKMQVSSKGADKQVVMLEDKLKKVVLEKEALELKLDDMEKKIRDVSFQKEKDYDELLKKVKTILASSNDDMQKRTSQLESRIFEATSIIDNLKEENTDLKTKLDQYKDKKYISMEKFETIEKKHAKNYKIFNETVASLEKEKKSIKEMSDEKIEKFKKEFETRIDELQKKYLDANASLEILTKNFKEVESENKDLKSIENRKKEEYFVKYQDSFAELNSTKIKLAQLLEKFDIVQKRNDKLALENNTLIKSLNLDKTEFVKRNKKFLDEINEQRAKIESLEKTLQDTKEENIELTEANAQIAKENYEKLTQMKNDFLESQSKLSLTSNELEKLKKILKIMKENNNKNDKQILEEMASKDEKIRLLEVRLKNVGETLKFTQDKLVHLKDDKYTLEKDISLLNSEIEALKSSNISSEKINLNKIEKLSLEMEEKSNIIKEKNEEIKNLKKEIKFSSGEHNKSLKSLEDKLASLSQNSSNKEELRSKYNTVLNDLRNRKAEIMTLKNEIENLKVNSKEKTEEIKIKELEEKNKEIEDLQKTLEALYAENDLLNQKIKNEKKVTKELKPLKLVSSIRCDDMKTGSNGATKNCKKRVKEFLSKYSANHFYEIVPIIDKGGFASLKKIQKSNIGIKKEEIERLTRLSNIGLGKDRAKVGGDLIVEKFGDLSRISYSNSNEKISQKRGFIIKVYE